MNTLFADKRFSPKRSTCNRARSIDRDWSAVYLHSSNKRDNGRRERNDYALYRNVI
jgi:hypothetical protein